MNKTQIQYADFVTNPLRVYDNDTGRTGWACIKHGHGCDHCWAETINQRFGTRCAYTAAAMKRLTPYIDTTELARMEIFNPKGPFKFGDVPFIFTFDMTDVMLPTWDPWRLELFGLMALRNNINWLVLTKRGDRLTELLDPLYVPAPNIHIGLTIPYEDDQTEQHISRLHDCHLNGWSTWVSHEPALGPVCWPNYMTFVSFLVSGGESGNGRRSPDGNWFRLDRDWCVTHGVPFFFKQWGEGEPQPAQLDGKIWQQMPIKAKINRLADITVLEPA